MTENPYTDFKNIQPGYRNGIWDWKMSHAYDEKWKRETMEEIELLNQERIRTLGEKKKYKYQGIFEADAT